MCPDQESNWWPSALWEDTQPTEPYQPGHVLDSLAQPAQMNSVYFSAAPKQTPLAWLETKKSL